MTCYQPLIRYEFPNLKFENKKGGLSNKAKIIPAAAVDSYEKHLRRNNIDFEVMKIPCGHCIGCRLDYSKEWANRCMLEAKHYKENYFVTLTYDDEHLPKAKIIEEETGEIKGEGNPLIKKDLQDFIKRIRSDWKYKDNHEGIRFYGCGEYGTKNERSHFHVIFFNMPIKPAELKFYKMTENKDILYTCPRLEKIWGKGFVIVGEVNWSTCAYVARYMTKKQKGNNAKEHYAKKGQTPEFCIMSRRPGIAKLEYDLHKNEIYKHDEVTVKNNCGVQNVKPPKYYDRLYDVDHKELMEIIKQKRKEIAKQQMEIKANVNSYSMKKQMEIDEEARAQKALGLVRDL